MLGPVFNREVVVAPRRSRWHISRGVYVFALGILASTAWQILAGTQEVRNIGDLARFGGTIYRILAPLQLVIMLFISALSAASAVSLEKDRRTLELLLLSKLTNSELVLGKLLASMLEVLVLVASSLPVFLIFSLLGGVSLDQIARTFAVTVASVLVAGSLGSTLALWREKTFQTLAMTTLAVVFWIAGWQFIALGALGEHLGGVPAATLAAGFSPWEAILEATRPYVARAVEQELPWWAQPIPLFLSVSTFLTLLLNLIGIAMIRVWNPSRELRRGPVESDGEAVEKISGKIVFRTVWKNPILWREARTWAYGRKIFWVRLAYLGMFALSVVGVWGTLQGEPPFLREDIALPVVPLMVLSLVLINAQAVTAITSERDSRALDLLLVTDLSPPEIILGKLGGILYNTKEMVLLPLILCGYLHSTRQLGTENLFFIIGSWLVMVAFVAMLGIHSGMNYSNSRGAIGVSLGTVFFLFLGVAFCMRIMVAFSSSFQVQLQPFLAFMLGGGIGLYMALGYRNPSPAITAASMVVPFATFYAITSLLLEQTLAPFLVIIAAYGFTTAAMLIPALFEFDIATGRTTGGND